MVSINKPINLFFNSDLFSLQINPDLGGVVINMQLHTGIVNTRYYPHTYEILNRFLPSVLKTRCFNDRHLPFRKEVNSTEIGHLFEHILLEYLCIQKSQTDSKVVVFNGKTKWNWVKNQYGSFEIKVDASSREFHSLVSALRKTIILTLRVLTLGYAENKSVYLNENYRTSISPLYLTQLDKYFAGSVSYLQK